MKGIFALLVRSLREYSRLRFIHLLYVGVLLLLLFLIFVTQQTVQWAGSPGRTFFGMVIGLNFPFITFAGLALFGSAVADEKEEGTMGLLRMTNLNPLSILLGKTGGRFVTLLLILAIQVPFVYLAVTLGGVSSRQIFDAYSLLASYLVAVAGLSVLFSTLFRRVWQASLAVVVLGFLLTAPMVIAPIVRTIATVQGSEWWMRMAGAIGSVGNWCWSLHPLKHMTLLPRATVYPDLEFNILVYLGTGVVALLLAWALFDRFCGDEEAFGRANRAGVRRGRRNARRAWTRWPIVWQTYYYSLWGIRVSLWQIVAFALVGWMTWAMVGPKDSERWRHTILAIAVTAFWLSGIVVGLGVGTLWGRERWGRTLSALLTSPRSLLSMHPQKLAALLLTLWPSALAFLAFAISEALVRGSDSFWVWIFRLRYREVQAIATMAALGMLLIAFVFNFSLRFKWAALPAAGAAWIFTGLGTTVVYGPLLSSISRSYDDAYGPMSLVTYIALALYLFRNGHALIERAAAAEG